MQKMDLGLVSIFAIWSFGYLHEERLQRPLLVVYFSGSFGLWGHNLVLYHAWGCRQLYFDFHVCSGLKITGKDVYYIIYK